MLLECKNCGAPLDVAGTPDLVKCGYCGMSASLAHLRTLNVATPKDWQQPKEWRPPNHVPADSSHTYRYRSGLSVPVVLALGVVLLSAIASVGGMIATHSNALPTDGSCPATFTGFGGQSMLCRCSEMVPTGPVWGTTLYTADSSVCRAALHAGAIGSAGGEVELRSASGCSNYRGSAANGVESHSWGAYGQSFYFVGHGDGSCAQASVVISTAQGGCPKTFLAANAERVECTCASAQSAGPVWGSSTYTADSSLCQAALHAGAVTAAGGRVVARSAPGCAKYVGSKAHGVAANSWAQFHASFYFEGHGDGSCR
jgi:hypothetical protein